jgi:predicted NBD/HSP70 family sugar kinase
LVLRVDAEIAQGEIRRRNLSRILNQLHLRGSMTRSELALSLRVNRSTVASLVAELSSRGLVVERRRGRALPQPAPGRPSPVAELSVEGPAVLALEFSTDWIRTAVIRLGASVVACAEIDRALSALTLSSTLDGAYELVARMLAELPRRPRLVAIGVSVPGVVRAEDGHVYHAPNLGWNDVALGTLVRQRFASLGVPVFVGNDADLATWAEHLRGSGRGTDDFICLWGEGGLGAGVVVGGRALAGAAGYAGEVGHMVIDPNGPECRCGSRGCWESEVGEEALLARSGRDPSGGSAAVSDLLAAAAAGDRRALDAMAESGRWLGIGIAGLVNIFNPARLALGGLNARIYPYSKEALLRELNWRAMPAPRAMLELTTARLGADALLIGASELAFAPILQDPTIVPLSGDPAPVDFRRRASPPLDRWSRPQPAQGGDNRLEFSGQLSLSPV